MSKDISRRSFLKGAAASMAGVAAMGLVGAPVLASAEENWDLETDVLVVGGGGTGVSAAAEAAAAGVKVLVLEKSGIVGGTSNLSGGVMQAAGTKYQKEFTKYQDDTPENHAAVWIKEGEGLVDEELVKDLANGAPAHIDWLADTCGLKWTSIYGHCHIPYVEDEIMADRIHVYEGGGDGRRRHRRAGRQGNPRKGQQGRHPVHGIRRPEPRDGQAPQPAAVL